MYYLYQSESSLCKLYGHEIRICTPSFVRVAPNKDSRFIALCACTELIAIVYLILNL